MRLASTPSLLHHSRNPVRLRGNLLCLATLYSQYSRMLRMILCLAVRLPYCIDNNTNARYRPSNDTANTIVIFTQDSFIVSTLHCMSCARWKSFASRILQRSLISRSRGHKHLRQVRSRFEAPTPIFAGQTAISDKDISHFQPNVLCFRAIACANKRKLHFSFAPHFTNLGYHFEVLRGD